MLQWISIRFVYCLHSLIDWMALACIAKHDEIALWHILNTEWALQTMQMNRVGKINGMLRMAGRTTRDMKWPSFVFDWCNEDWIRSITMTTSMCSVHLMDRPLSTLSTTTTANKNKIESDSDIAPALFERIIKLSIKKNWWRMTFSMESKAWNAK